MKIAKKKFINNVYGEKLHSQKQSAHLAVHHAPQMINGRPLISFIPSIFLRQKGKKGHQILNVSVFFGPSMRVKKIGNQTLVAIPGVLKQIAVIPQ